MTDFEYIYLERAEDYDAMVSQEDYQGNILQTLQSILPLADLRVVEFGTGTGRLTRILSRQVASILATDLAEPMLRIAQRRESEIAPSLGWLILADNRWMPVRPGHADLVLGGWSLGHSIEWYPENWRQVVADTIGEMKRLLAPEGHIVILETLGTGQEEPKPPTQGLADYYTLLEEQFDFHRKWARTDYQFESVRQADRLVRFFFGDELADRIVEEQITTLPECTGFWYWKNS